MRYTFFYVDAEDNDLQKRDYEFDSFAEAKEHAINLLAVDCSDTKCIQITAEDYSVIRERVYYMQ